MAIIESWFNQDLKEAVKVRYLDGNIFSADNAGNLIGVNVLDGGSPASLSGSVAANIIRADGATIAAQGSFSGNKASVILPQAAYAIPGPASVIIKLTSGDTITTLCAVVANVYQSATDSTVDPGTIIPSIETLIAEIEAAIESIPADYSSLWTTLAPAFNSGTTYSVGQYCTYGGYMYRFTTAHSGSWDYSHVTLVNIGNELYTLDGKISTSKADILSVIAPPFNSETLYVYGQYCTRNGNLYRCTATEHTGAWNGTHFIQVDVGGQLYNRYTEEQSIWNSIAPEFTASKPYIVGEYCSRNQKIWKCIEAHSGAWNSSHFTEAQVGSEIFENGKGIDYIKNILEAGYIFKEIIPNGPLNENNAKFAFPAETADIISIKIWGPGISASTAAVYFWYHGESSHTFVGNINVGSATDFTPSGDIDAIEFYATGTVNGQPVYIEAMDTSTRLKALSDISQVKYTLYKPAFTNLASGYVNKAGETVASNTTYHADKISVSTGDIIYRKDGEQLRMVAAYFGETVVQSAGVETAMDSYTVPEGVNGIIITVSASTLSQAQIAFDAIVRKNFTAGVYVISDEQVDYIAKSTIDKYDPHNAQAYSWNGNLSANQTVDTGFAIAPKIGFRAGFFGKLSGTFDKVTLQIDEYSPNRVVVDGTNVTISSRYHSAVSYAHGLTITNDIYVSVIANECDSVDVIVASNGVQAKITGVFWVTAYEPFKLINGTSALTDAVLTIGCGTINHRIWVIGDSYTSMESNERWTYYLNQNDFVKNVMVCGSTGSGREESDRWMNSLLQIGTPKTIIWCMGMNYTPDYENPPYLASDWKDQVDWLMDYCTAHEIELILATIPSVPSRKNEHKNQYVRESGFRYIDFAEAVGAQADGTWYPGMLSSDNIHPSATGAIAMFNKAITTVPELTYDYQ